MKEKLKQLKKDGLISSKALKEQKKQLDKALEDEIEVLKLEIPKEN